MTKYNSILIDSKDNVVTTLHDIEQKEEITASGLNVSLFAVQKIERGHKVALKNFSKGDEIFKYGIKIGTSVSDILAGGHVHIHNIKSNRGKELKEE